MVLRVFGFIWGTMILSMALIALLVKAFDWAPPEGARLKIEQRLIAAELALFEARGGLRAAEEHWSLIADAHPDFSVTRHEDCQSGACLLVLERDPQSNLLDSLYPFLTPLLIGAALAAVASILLSQWLTRPIRTVSVALTQLADGQLETRIGVRLRGSTGELSQLARDFDHAAERLQELTETRQRLFHDVSHEIRSPLARLRAAIGLLALRPERHEALRTQMETDVARLDYLVDGILTLARLDSGQSAVEMDAIDLLDILVPILDDANFEGEARKVTVLYDGPATLPVTGQAELLHRALENVIRNALTYSPDGGVIAITGSQSDGWATIAISDAGPGVDPTDLPCLFHPFHRSANANPARGSGLGLAIAERAIALHNGTIEALPGDAGGLKVSMRIMARRG